ncbi:retrovirus-related pol polyprotein from transposon TNT 1-94 [Tanacetum coccineum]
MKGKSVETKFEKPSVIRQSNSFKSQRQSVLGKPATFLDSLAKTYFSKAKSVTTNNVSNDLSKLVTAQILPQNMKSILKNTNMIAPGISTTLRKSTVSNTPSSSNSFSAHRDNFIHRRLWVIKAHDGKSQASKECNYQKGLLRRRAESQFFLRWSIRDADLEVSFRKSTCYIRDLKGNDLPTGSRGTDLYSITLQDTSTPNPICLMAKASSSQACWGKQNASLSRLKIPQAQRDVYKFYTWTYVTHFLRSKDETPEVLINFLKLVQRGLHAQVRTVQIDKGTKFLNKTLHAYFAQEGIKHQLSTAQTPKQNGIVERQNRTLVEAARTMLSIANVPLFFWAEAIATTCFTQNRSLLIPRHEKTPYHIINGRKPSVKFFHIFGSLCYIIRDGENLDKMKEKGDACIFVGYSTQSRAYRVYNKRTKVIIETIHVNFEELPQMASEHVSSDPVPQSETVTTSNEMDLLFSMIFDELLNGTTLVMSMSFVVTATDAPNQRQQQNITLSTSTTVAADIPPLNIQTTPVTTNQAPTQAPTVTAIENINQAETDKEYAQVEEDEFINIFSTLVQERGETSSQYVDSSNMHTFYQ